MDRHTEDLDELAAAQDDVLTRAQLAGHGLERDRVRHQLVMHRWQSAGPRVVVLHNGPLTDRQQLWVAVLGTATRCALAGTTAAAEAGLVWIQPAGLHVVVPQGERVRRLPGVVVHRSRRFALADLHPARAIPTVRVERALIDGASWSRSPRQACGLLAAGVQQRLTTAPRLHAQLLACGLLRHRALLLPVLDDIEGGAQSFAEIDMGRLCRRAGLPTPLRQAVRTDGAGRRRYLDIDLGAFSVEVDGALHLRPLDHWADSDRSNNLVLGGQRILRFPSWLLRAEPETAVLTLRRAAAAWGVVRRRRAA